ncbi:MAG TPA: PLP-dependent aminotransferase family protein [Candidatus Angelobacter sp.]|nr:PLP-dependent aminotransferase family protein [Candidatus Angelobacter sp.]
MEMWFDEISSFPIANMTTLRAPKKRLDKIPPLIAVDRKAAKPLYQQIYEAYRSRIVSGELRAGELVPSTRELARELRISRLPVVNAYSQLLAEGHFESRVGSGTFIATTLPRYSRSHLWRRGRPGGAPRPVSARAHALPKFQRPNWVEQLGPFQVGQPDLRTFPVDIWSRLSSRYARELKVRALQYGHPMGLAELRESVATYLRTSRGVHCEPEQIMIVSGSQQALDVSTRVLLDPGARVWVENPGYWLVQHVLAAAGCRVIPVPVDSEGLDVAVGIKLARDARAAFVAPSHQYPLGVTMSATRRFQLLEWANQAGAWIIEDDYDSEYRYDSMPIASLQGLDTRDRVIYTGTFSKVLFPSLRIGYIVIPPDLVERFAAVRQAMDICPSHASQAVLAQFIREGHFARHIRRMRKVYEERRRVLMEEIEHAFGPSHKIMGASAGMHVALLLGNNYCDHDIVMKAAQRKLWLSALSLSYVASTGRQGLVLGFGNTATHQIPAAVLSLKTLLDA